MKAIAVGRTDDAQDLKLDVSGLLDSRLLIQGNSGAGKSWLMRLIAEQVAARVPTFILDPEGEYATLRERLDMVLVGQAGEVPADPRGAGLLARKLMELRVSAVIDLYDLKLGARREFVKLFLDSLLNLPKDLYKSPVLIGIDEAHLYCPEKSAGESVATESVIALMSQGRKRGLCGALLTQRLSKLHKDAAAECNNVVIGRTWLDTDQKRAGDALGLAGNDRQGLRDLAKGQFLAFGPAFSRPGVTRFQSAAVQTTHPQAGKRHTIEAPAPSAAITAVLPQLRDLPQQAAAQARTVEDLRAENAALKRQLACKPVQAPAVVQAATEVSVLKAEHVARLEKAAARLDAAADRAKAAAAEASGEAQQIRAALTAARTVSAQTHAHRGAVTVPNRGVRTPAVVAPVRSSDAALPRAERAILTAVAQRHPKASTKIQASILSGYSIKSSSFTNALGALRSGGLVLGSGDGIQITDAGLAALGDYPQMPPAEERVEWWSARLPKAERALLHVFAGAYPGEVSREQLSEQSGYSAASSSFTNALGKLRSLALVSGFRASEELFS